MPVCPVEADSRLFIGSRDPFFPSGEAQMAFQRPPRMGEGRHPRRKGPLADGRSAGGRPWTPGPRSALIRPIRDAFGRPRSMRRDGAGGAVRAATGGSCRRRVSYQSGGPPSTEPRPQPSAGTPRRSAL